VGLPRGERMLGSDCWLMAPDFTGSLNQYPQSARQFAGRQANGV